MQQLIFTSKNNLFFIFLYLFATNVLQAQCTYTPTVLGDNDKLLCTYETNTLTTQSYDSYQWYKRLYLSTTWSPIFGANTQTLAINGFNHAGFEFKVEVSLSGCIAESAPELVDGYAFASPVAQTVGSYTFDPNAQTSYVCIGDTVRIIGLTPYDTLYTWTKNGTQIMGQNSPTLAVTSSGVYTFIGASPKICPYFSVGLGVNSGFNFIPCITTDLNFKNDENNVIKIAPNPSHNDFFKIIGLNNYLPTKVLIYDLMGKVVYYNEEVYSDNQIQAFNLLDGVYFVKIKQENTTTILKLVINK